MKQLNSPELLRPMPNSAVYFNAYTESDPYLLVACEHKINAIRRKYLLDKKRIEVAMQYSKISKLMDWWDV